MPGTTESGTFISRREASSPRVKLPQRREKLRHRRAEALQRISKVRHGNAELLQPRMNPHRAAQSLAIGQMCFVNRKGTVISEPGTFVTGDEASREVKWPGRPVRELRGG